MVNGLKPYSLSGGDPASGPMRPGCLLRAVPSPLTPAFSLREREHHQQRIRPEPLGVVATRFWFSLSLRENWGEGERALENEGFCDQSSAAELA